MRDFMRFGRLALALAIVGLAAFVAVAADEKKDAKKEDDKKEPDVIFVPTPVPVVEKMLEMAKVGKDDVVYDLGCGDGRIVLTAARKYGCKAMGFDIDPDRIKECKEGFSKEKEETQKLVQFERRDIFKLDLSKATVVTLYLLPDLNKKLVPQLNKMKAGSRVVSHAFDIEGIKPDAKAVVKTKEDREYDVFLWTVP